MGKFCTSIKNAGTSLYFWACVVYFAYVCLILAVNYCQQIFPNTPFPPNVTSLSSSPTVATSTTPLRHFVPHIHDPFYWPSSSALLNKEHNQAGDVGGYDYDYIIAYQCQSKGDTPLNREFISASIIHVVNGIMFAFYWLPYFKKHPETPNWQRALLLLPEGLNIIEASLYIKSASMYGEASQYCDDYTCSLKEEMHSLETAASVLEFFASVGWFYSWYSTFPRGPGRGLTLWDPDFWAAVGLIVPSIIYVIYNVKDSLDPLDIQTNTLYLVADVIYWFDALIYLLAALRDAEFFWWLKVVPGCANPKGHHEIRELLHPAGTEETAPMLSDKHVPPTHCS